ncbi:ribosomal s35 mitochondrial [Zalerion maritima]|uniref:Ribosomal s35 mitochondrial n=1 Tax=Zalerion maritima TaxID=339359 RepID=A0AAD5RLS9_9PEZI|nr:ribosomal s35 mitochondrial [Zalerion maritima]
MFAWLQGKSVQMEYLAQTVADQNNRRIDENDKDPSIKRISAPQYVTGERERPFPMNNLFKSAPVLSDRSKNIIHKKIMEENRSVKAGRELAKPYAYAVYAMLPKSYIENAKEPHENINDVHAHRYTMQQLFLPVAESKRFTREDAARAFHRNLLPADKRLPIPELVQYEKDRLGGKGLADSMGRLLKDTTAMEQNMAERIKAREERDAARVTKVESGRFQFRFQNFEVEDVGRDGRGKKGTGWRYGVPLYDRQRGHTREVPEKVGI